MVKGAEDLFISRERAHKKIRDEFQVREALIKEREAAIDPGKIMLGKIILQISVPQVRFARLNSLSRLSKQSSTQE
ncbi:hypothetical protein H4I96_02137 [Botrytis cinerea]